MADATDTTRTPDGRPPGANPGAHARPGFLFVRDLPLAEVDILGGLDDGNRIAGNATLADLVGRRCGRTGQDGTPLDLAAGRLHLEQLGELTAPAYDLAGVALKLAWAVRAGQPVAAGNGAYGDAGMMLLGTLLSDVLLLRQAELVRRREPGAGRTADA